jgi:hypothetical protein
MTRFTVGIVLTLFAGAANSQVAATKPDAPKREFEVASVKIAPPPDGSGMISGVRGRPGTDDPTSVVFRNSTVSVW